MSALEIFDTRFQANVPLAHIGLDACARPELFFVIPAFNEADNIVETLTRVSEKPTALVESAEIIIVDNGSSDLTLENTRLAMVPTPVSILRLSRNFGKEQAVMAGLQRATGKAVVILDADLQEPLHYVDVMLERYREGYEMVYAVRVHRNDESRAKRIFTKIFYKMLNKGSDAVIPEDARDFRFMDRRVVDALCSLPERNRFMKGLYGWVGFRSVAVPIVIKERQNGTSKFGFIRLFKLALTGMTAFTSWPLRIWASVGMTLASLSIFYGIWFAIRTVIWGHELPGWSTLAVAIFFLGGIQSISIGVLGEYLARVFWEVKGRPGYLVAEEIRLESSS